MTKKKTASKQTKKLPPIPDKFEHKQTVIFELSGIPAKAIKFFRDQLPDNEWFFRNGVGYFYSDTAKQMLEKRIGVDLTVKREWVEVIKVGRNQYGLVCETMHTPPREVIVTVKDNTKFKMGRWIPVRNLQRDCAYLDMKNPTVLGR